MCEKVQSGKAVENKKIDVFYVYAMLQVAGYRINVIKHIF